MRRVIQAYVMLARLRCTGIVRPNFDVVLLVRLAARLGREVLVAPGVRLQPIRDGWSRGRCPRWQAGSPARHSSVV